MAPRRFTLPEILASALVTGALLTAPAPAAAAPATLSPEATAIAAAARDGESVPVAGTQTETSRTYATPTGNLVFESYPVPRWVNTPGRGWQQIDKRLRLADGAVTPVATLAATRFSAGGTDPVVSLPVAGGDVSFSWPSALPTPRLDGDTAVYPEVLAGVDLRVTALVDGFSWALVVRSKEAAQNPALDTLRFRVGTKGLSAGSRKGGGLSVRDRAGTEVVSAENAVMWDAAGPATARELTRSAPDFSHRAELPTTMDGTDLRIVPDPKVLRGATTVYPVVIDPSTTINKTRWGYSNKGNATKNDNIARVGTDPDGTGISRSFFAFDLTALAGKQIKSAKFLTTMTHSWACTATPVNLWRTAALTAAGKQTWDGPDLKLWIQQLSGNAHKPSTGAGCSNDPQPNKPLEFTAAALRTDIDAVKGSKDYTLALTARQSDGAGESTASWWKKFDPAATKLTIEYNSLPNTPTSAQMSETADYTATPQACVTGTGRPVLRSAKPWLKATLTDPDGPNGGTLSGAFTLQRWNGTDWLTVPGWPQTKTQVQPDSKAELEVQIDSGIADGDLLRWQVQVSDTLGGTSDVSPLCEFDVDMTGPSAHPAVASADGLYPENGDTARGSLGRSGSFTLGANGQGDVASYTYQVNGGTPVTATPGATGGAATVWATPTRAGENVLTVRSFDLAGNASAAYDYTFLVDRASTPAAVWPLDDGTGTTAKNSVTGGPALTLTNAPTWVDDRIVGTHAQTGKARALKFNGTTQSGDTAAPVVDTARSFSVATWVKLSSNTGYQSFISQDGLTTKDFSLQSTPSGDNHFRFNVGPATAISTSLQPIGVWTHLAGVYDAGTQQVRIYVNGVLDGSAAYSATGTGSNGPMHVGRDKTGEFVSGTIGEARVWDRVIDPATEIVPLAKPVKVAEWEMEDWDEDAPRQVVDDSGYARPLTLATTTQWGDGYNFSTGLLLDGVSASAATATPVISTDQSFSVTAWVRRDQTTGNQAIWGQSGTVNSSAYLRYQEAGGGAWVFGMPTTDTTAATQVTASATGPTAAWTHLAATYDAGAGQLKLYVNGVLKATTAYRATWGSTGVFTVGRLRSGSADTNFFTGAVDRVRVWQGALTADDVTVQYNEI
ncbi:LamG domain-containing protein [Actinoplanes sp. HUAS TT8]|uniref:LamG domain-containing protein n=1 Tax=Actinoplanes sp. HUAS TT8 TaxID=3447453 RepID=UPI003F51D14E